MAVAELAMQRFVRPPDAGSSPVSHLRMWCKRVAYCDRNAEARFKSDIFNRHNITTLICDPYSNLFQVVKKSLSSLIIRFESGNQRVMNQKGETKNDNHYDH